MGVRQAVAAALAIWLLALLYFTSSLYSIQTRRESHGDDFGAKLDVALAALEKLQKHNEGLKDLVEKERREHAESLRLLRDASWRGRRPPAPPPTDAAASTNGDGRCLASSAFSKEHEEMRRAWEDGVWEAFYYTRSHVDGKKETSEAVAKHLHKQLISLLGLARRFSAVEGADEKRAEGLGNLTQHIQHHIERLQNPAKCGEARILLCDLDKQCGFGCQLHHVAYCFVVAFAEQRTLILEKDGRSWRYAKDGWTSAFLPVSSCTHEEALSGGGQAEGYTQHSAARVVTLPIVDALSESPPFLPLSFPSSIASQLMTLHSNPPVFFVAQFLWYLMRSSDEMKHHLESVVAKVPFQEGPVVGLQVRRTDKIGTEASFHAIDEYMEWVEIWFRVEESRLRSPLKRRVFIATDDASVVAEARKKFPSYSVFGDERVAAGAAVSSRYTMTALHGIVADIHLLSHCSHLVCTFSSQVCRMGYELMQVRQNSSGEQFHSLDDIYYFGGQQAHEQTAVEAHAAESKEEIDLEVGDVVGIAGNHWDGFSKGNNRRSGKTGLYPSYKVQEKWRTLDFPALPPLP